MYRIINISYEFLYVWFVVRTPVEKQMFALWNWSVYGLRIAV